MLTVMTQYSYIKTVYIKCPAMQPLINHSLLQYRNCIDSVNKHMT